MEAANVWSGRITIRAICDKGERFAVLSAKDWEAFVEWAETLEAVQIARTAFAELKEAGGDRQQAGWLEWEAVRDVHLTTRGI